MSFEAITGCAFAALLLYSMYAMGCVNGACTIFGWGKPDLEQPQEDTPDVE